ncbi:UvrD-helicase domain-containing protein [Nocardiopsis sp. NPDC055879]
MAQLAVHRDFLQEFAKLHKPVQNRVTEVFAKFEQATHTGVHLEKIAKARDDRFRSIRIDQFWRGVVLAPTRGDTYTLLRVLPHDEAYEWAKRRTASVNLATGGIEIRDVEAMSTSLPFLEQMAQKAPARLFEHVGDADLTRLGVDEQTRTFARALTDTEQLNAAQGLMPPVQWTVLCGLASGMSPEEVWDELGSRITEEFDPEDLDSAVRRSSDRVLLVEGPDELMAVLAHPFDLWRIYLHPAQRQVVDAVYRGSARVSGGPGTGKTVVALHRAHRLAERGRGAVLLTTFTSTLARSLEQNLTLLAEHTGDPLSAGRVRVENIDRFAHRVFRETHGRPNLLTGNQEQELWERLAKELGASELSPAFLSQEWRQVVLARRVESADAYLAAKRTGRGRGLSPARKAVVWQVMWAFQREITKRGLWTHETVCEEAARLLARLPDADKPYRHVVVDEAQDLYPGQWRLLRAAVSEGPDDLFVTADAHQRVYGPQVVLSEVGVDVRGRSSKLRINYRTTAEILDWSLGLVHGQSFDDLEGGPDHVTGCRSEMHGLPPEVKGLATWGAELAHMASIVRGWTDSGVLPEEIGVAARSRRLAREAALAIEESGLRSHLLEEGEGPGGAVLVGTMHRMKGLEFRCLAVVAAGEAQLPAPRSVTPEEEDPGAHSRDLLRERSLLFVACTRAREQLSVSWHGLPSPFIEAVQGR